MSISYNGYSEHLLTFNAANGFTSSDVAVKLTSNDTVGGCSVGDTFCGVSKAVRDGIATVRLSGVVTLPYTSTAPTVGYSVLAANGSGGVKVVSEGGRSMLVLNVDSTNSKVTFLL